MSSLYDRAAIHLLSSTNPRGKSRQAYLLVTVVCGIKGCFEARRDIQHILALPGF